MGIAAGHSSPLLESWERSRVNPEPNAPTQAPPQRWGLSNPGGTPPWVRGVYGTEGKAAGKMTKRRGWIAARTRVTHHQRPGVVDRQPARGWPPRQRTGRHERSCPPYFHSFPRALLECCHSCGIAGALNRRCHRGRASGRRAPTPEGQTAPAVHRHNAAHSGGTRPCQLGRAGARRAGLQTRRGLGRSLARGLAGPALKGPKGR